ncbi:MAG: hypothetical protein ACE5F1_06960 [Planctomycetota bacterium]
MKIFLLAALASALLAFAASADDDFPPPPPPACMCILNQNTFPGKFIQNWGTQSQTITCVITANTTCSFAGAVTWTPWVPQTWLGGQGWYGDPTTALGVLSSPWSPTPTTTKTCANPPGNRIFAWMYCYHQWGQLRSDKNYDCTF